GAGTVVAGHVAPPPARPEAPAPALTRERIVRAGIGIADKEGLEAVSMRRVASELGAGPMALYRHIADKEDLVLRMLDRVYADVRLPEPPPSGWRAAAEAGAKALWEACHVHPWMAPATSMMRPQIMPGVLPLADYLLSAVAGLGLSHGDTFTAYLALLNFVRGMGTNLDAEAQQQALTGMDNEAWLATQEPAMREALASGDYPTFRRFTSREYDFDLDRIFEFGLQRLLDGLDALRSER
ncbi:MAG: TetR/AcrR family transcriptional regulator, partial [Candidatus Dormibacteraceae bacterium]